MSRPRLGRRSRREPIELDEFGNARDALKSCLPPELVEKVFIARANCPEEAIIRRRGLIGQGFETVAGLEASMRSVLRLPTPPVTRK